MENIIGSSKQKNLIFLVVFVLLWGGLVLWNFVQPEKSFSQAENRNLASFPVYTTPDLLSGKFMDGVNVYLNDQFVARDQWVSTQSVMEYGLGKREINGVYVTRERLYRHYPPPNQAVSDANIQGINSFYQQYQIPTSVLIVPSSTYIYRQQLPLFATSWEEGDYISGLGKTLDSGVKLIDITPTLEADKGKDIYYKTDHHWTSLGAYLGYQALAEEWQFPEKPLEDFTQKEVSHNFLGTNQSRTALDFIAPDVIESYQLGQAEQFIVTDYVQGQWSDSSFDSIYFPEYLTGKDQYSYFLGDIKPYVTIHTQSQSGKKLLIFKDSYAHCLAPMLLEDYSEIRLVDLRSFNEDDYGSFVQAQQYDQVLFLYSTDTFSQQVGPGKLAK